MLLLFCYLTEELFVLYCIYKYIWYCISLKGSLNACFLSSVVYLWLAWRIPLSIITDIPISGSSHRNNLTVTYRKTSLAVAAWSLGSLDILDVKHHYVCEAEEQSAKSSFKASALSNCSSLSDEQPFGQQSPHFSVHQLLKSDQFVLWGLKIIRLPCDVCALSSGRRASKWPGGDST